MCAEDPDATEGQLIDTIANQLALCRLIIKSYYRVKAP